MNPYQNLDIKYKKIEDSFQKLNKYQKEAILNNDNILLLNAAVGSGKTTVLINKVLYLHIIRNVPLERMFVLTFTNKAADEIKYRFKEFGINPDYNSTRYFGTFHGIARKLLDNCENLEELGYKRNFSIIDQEEQIELLYNIIDEHELTIKYRNRVIRRLDRYKAGAPLYGNMKYHDDIEKLFYEYEDEKKKNNIMDFDDLIKNCIKILRCNTQCIADYVIVDEFQDCNSDQIELIELLAGAGASIFAVGDPNQTIYTWRGSRLDIFLKFQKKTKARQLTLPLNYRSTTNILEAARIFLDGTSDLVGTRELGTPVTVVRHYNEFMEAMYISEKIKRLISKKYLFKDFCILYRKLIQSKPFEETFTNEKIPFEVSTRKSIHDIPALYWFIRLLKASINEYDKNTMISILTDSKFGVLKSKKEAAELLYSHGKTSASPLIEKIFNFKNNQVPLRNIYQYFEIDKYIKPNSAEYNENKQYIVELIDKIYQYLTLEGIEEQEGLKEFINNSALYGAQIVEEKVNMNMDSVKLMTLHSSKGLEFRYVFIIGANNGLLPLRSYNDENIEEERRLFFVGLTRARDNLEISYYTSPSETNVCGYPGEFINMMKNYSRNRYNQSPQEKQEIAKIAKKILLRRNSRKDKPSVHSKKVYAKNRDIIMVKHKKYGTGRIISKKDGIIEVIFENYGKKKFAENFVELVYL